MKKIFLVLFLILLFLPFIQVGAADLLPLVQCGGLGESACQLCDFFEMLDRIIRFILFDIVPPVAALMIAVGGFMLIYAYAGGGGPETISKAKSAFKAVIIGLLIVYGAWLVIDLFFSIISVNKSFLQSWNEICK